MVSGAVFSDIDGDGDRTCSSPSVGRDSHFLNDHGRFRAAEFPGLSDVKQPLNGLATATSTATPARHYWTSWGRNLD